MPVSNKYLFIRSSDRTIGSAGAFTVPLPTTYHNVSGISLVSAEIPFSFYNVAGAYTTGVQFVYAGSTYNMSIPGGQYTITDFQAAMLSALKAAFPTAGFTAVNYSTVSAVLSITYTGGGTFSAGATTAGGLGKLMGCDPTYAVTTAVSGTLTFPSVAQLFPFSSLLMCVDNLPANVLSTSTIHAFARIQVNAPPGGVIMVCNGTNVVNSVAYASPIASIGSLAITLKNNDGSLLNLNSVDWTCTLMISSTD